MATGALNAQGVWIYGEDDSETTFSALLNKLGGSVANTMKGRIVQVVSNTYSVATTSSTVNYADTGLTATITPQYSNSRILVIVNQNGCYKDTGNTANGLNLRLLRGGSVIVSLFGYAIGNTATNSINFDSTASAIISDSPGVTTAVTYKTQLANLVNSSVVGVQTGGTTSSIVLVEIRT